MPSIGVRDWFLLHVAGGLYSLCLVRIPSCMFCLVNMSWAWPCLTSSLASRQTITSSPIDFHFLISASRSKRKRDLGSSKLPLPLKYRLCCSKTVEPVPLLELAVGL